MFVLEINNDMVESEGRFRDAGRTKVTAVPLTGANIYLLSYLHYCNLTVIVNPTITLGQRKVVHREGCLSIPGYSAHVPRSLDAVVS